MGTNLNKSDINVSSNSSPINTSNDLNNTLHYSASFDGIDNGPRWCIVGVTTNNLNVETNILQKAPLCLNITKGYVIKTSSTEEGSSLEELERSVLDLPTLYTQVAVAGSKAPINDQHDFRIEKRHRYWRQWLFRSRWPIIGVKKKCWEAEENINWRKLILQDSPDYYSKAISFEDHNNEQCQWLISMIC